MGKINNCIWFHSEEGKVSKVLDYYKKIFDENFQSGEPISLGDTPDGYSEMAYIQLYGTEYLFMTTANEHHSLNDSFSIVVSCKNQIEIDKLWNYFTEEGEESQCGWCSDKFGLRWQIIPENFGELMSLPNSWEIMMNQKKIIIEEYLS